MAGEFLLHSILDTIICFVAFVRLIFCGRAFCRLRNYQMINIVLNILTFSLLVVLAGLSWAMKNKNGLLNPVQNLPGLKAYE
jgi:hypothetical protein